jgi:hypothetical protein
MSTMALASGVRGLKPAAKKAASEDTIARNDHPYLGKLRTIRNT